MIDYPDRDQTDEFNLPDPPPQETLDEVIEQCILSIEDGAGDVGNLIARFPKWKSQISEFFDNLGSMNRVKADLLHPNHRPIDIDEFPDRKFGDYELIESIGVGGMGVIYKARQISLGRIVALKMIQSQRRDGNRFKLEAESAAALSHPNIVSIYEIGEYQGRLFFSMELIEGFNLSDYLKRGPVDVREAARITKTIAEAVHYAHQHGILHRDLKPANILLDIEAQPHVTDFGLAKQLGRDTELTKSGTIMGTPGYMAPEQAKGKTSHWTIATDVYGLGAILYALLTGQAPFTGESSLDTLRRVVDEVPPKPRSIRPKTERDIDTICMKCLEKSPQMRYSTAKQLADDLSRFLLGQPVKARPIAMTERMWRWCFRNPAYSMLSAAVAILLVATIVFLTRLIVNEQKTRFIVEEKARTEERLKKEIEDVLTEKQLLTKMEQRRRGKLFLDRAFDAADAADSCHALFWFSQSARLASDDQEAFQRNFLRAQSWLDHHPFPTAAWMLSDSGNLTDSTTQEHIVFRPASVQFLLIRNRQFTVGNCGRQQLWHLEKSFPGITCAAWSTDGQYLAIGMSGATVLLLNADNREIVQRIETNQPVDQIAFSASDHLLAIATSDSATSTAHLMFWNTDLEQPFGSKIELPNRAKKLCFDRSANRVVVTDQSQHCAVYKRQDGQFALQFKKATYLGPPNSNRRFWPTLISDDSILLLQKSPNSLAMLNMESGNEIHEHQLEEEPQSLDVDQDTNRLIVHGTRSIEVWQILTETEAIKTLLQANPKIMRFLDRLEHEQQILDTELTRDCIVATAGKNKSVSIWRMDETTDSRWDVPYQKELLMSLPHQDHVRLIRFSDDGTHLATLQTDGLLRIWEYPKQDRVHYRVRVPRSGSQAKLIGRQRWLTTGLSRYSRNSGRTGAVENAKIFDQRTGDLIGQTSANLESDGPVMDAACAPDHRQLATAHAHAERNLKTIKLEDGTGGSIQFWEWPEFEAAGEPIDLPGEPRCVEYSPDGTRLAVCTMNLEVVLINTHTREIEDVLVPTDLYGQTIDQRLLKAPYYDNGKLKYSPDGKTIVVWGSNKGVWVWDVDSETLRFPPADNHGRFATRVEFSPDGKRIAIAGGRNKAVQIFDIETGEVLALKIFRTSVVNSASFSPDGTKIVAGIRDGKAVVYEWSTGQVETVLSIPSVDCVDATYSPDGKFIFTLGLDHRLRVWCSSDYRMALRPISTPPWARQILVGGESDYVIVASGRHEIAGIDLKACQESLSFDLSRTLLSAELIAGKILDGEELSELNSNEWYSRWQRLQYVSR